MAAELAYDFNTALPLQWPERQPQTERPSVQRKKRPAKKPISKAQARRNARLNNIMVAKIFIAMALSIFVIGICVHSFELKDTSLLAMEAKQTELDMQKDRKKVLTDKLNKLVTEDNVDKVATQLGLVKISRGNENYVDSNPENRVVFAKGMGLAD